MGFNRFQRAVLSDYDNGSHKHLLGCESLKDTMDSVDPIVYRLLNLLQTNTLYVATSSFLNGIIGPRNEIDAALHLMEALDLEIASRHQRAGVVHERRLHTDPK
jgi:hypothetical protein